MCIAIKRNIEEILNIRMVMDKIKLTKEQKKTYIRDSKTLHEDTKKQVL